VHRYRDRIGQHPAAAPLVPSALSP
jgi:hypothetical protein